MDDGILQYERETPGEEEYEIEQDKLNCPTRKT